MDVCREMVVPLPAVSRGALSRGSGLDCSAGAERAGDGVPAALGSWGLCSGDKKLASFWKEKHRVAAAEIQQFQLSGAACGTRGARVRPLSSCGAPSAAACSLCPFCGPE